MREVSRWAEPVVGLVRRSGECRGRSGGTYGQNSPGGTYHLRRLHIDMKGRPEKRATATCEHCVCALVAGRGYLAETSLR